MQSPILNQLINDIEKNRPEIKNKNKSPIFNHNRLQLINVNYDYDDTKH